MCEQLHVLLIVTAGSVDGKIEAHSMGCHVFTYWAYGNLLVSVIDEAAILRDKVYPFILLKFPNSKVQKIKICVGGLHLCGK